MPTTYYYLHLKFQKSPSFTKAKASLANFKHKSGNSQFKKLIRARSKKIIEKMSSDRDFRHAMFLDCFRQCLDIKFTRQRGVPEKELLWPKNSIIAEYADFLRDSMFTKPGQLGSKQCKDVEESRLLSIYYPLWSEIKHLLGQPEGHREVSPECKKLIDLMNTDISIL